MFEESASNPSIWASMNSWLTPTVLFVLLNLMIGTIFFSSNLSKHEENQEHQNDPQQQPKLDRSPSVLKRLRSINLGYFRSQELPPITSFFKQTLDSNSQQANQNKEEESMDTQTHYIFEEAHHQETLTRETHFDLEQTHEPESMKTETHFVPDETYGQEDEENEELQSIDEIYGRLSQLTGSHVGRTTSDMKPASGEVTVKLPEKMRKSASMKSAFGRFEESDILETRRPATVRERRIAKVTDGDDGVDAKADDFINKFKNQLKLQRLDSIIRYKEVISSASAK